MRKPKYIEGIDIIFRYGTVLSFLFLLGRLQVVSETARPSKPCLSFEESSIELRGKIERRVFLEENEISPNKRQIFWVIGLNDPICISGGAEEFINSEDNVKDIQLVVGSDQYEKYRKFLGKQVSVRGTLFPAHTAHHFTRVLVDLASISKTNFDPK